MGKRGRKPIPTKLKIVNGNPGKRPLNEAEPEPEAVELEELEIPELVSNLPEALAIWEEQAEELQRVGLLTKVDVPMFAAYCYYMGKFHKHSVKMSKSGFFYKNGSQRNPQPDNTQADKAFDRALKLAQQFGLTPSSRTNIKTANSGDDESGDNEFFD